MSLVLHIDELIQTLFDNQTFQSKLQQFITQQQQQDILLKQCKSIRTDVSDKLELSQQSRTQPEIQSIVGQIQQILVDLYGKCFSSGSGGDGIAADGSHLRVNHNHNHNHNSNNNNVVDNQKIWTEIQRIKSDLQQMSIQNQSSQQRIQNLVTDHEKYVTVDQHYRWQLQMLEKMEIVIKRNFHKVQSMFADKLNTFQMGQNFAQKDRDREGSFVKSNQIQNQYGNQVGNKSDGKTNTNPEIKTIKKQREKEDARQTNQSEITKKLKSAKSLGSLFGFKK